MKSILDFCPLHGYQDNEIVNWLVGAIEAATGNESIEMLLYDLENGLIMYPDFWVDFTPAKSYGLWRPYWTKEQKVGVVLAAYQIQQHRGTKTAILLLFDALGYPLTFFQDMLVIPLSISPFSQFYRDLTMMVDSLSPVNKAVPIVYDHFYADVSQAGHPIL